eukprot:TRINITY_DN21169_c0_g1_i1.p1 TRINITY_DN21169_c0_g1~~TRINITY_DN21169_c0_g1_i1.p1  ORF type:complete len:223 (-),score=57.08 TRINITY_DN21169_c0_g1_i1:76-744(-)
MASLLLGYLMVLLASLAGSVTAEKDNIVKLTKFNFDDNVKRGSWFVKFYAPWCTHCQRLAPIWEKLADQAVAKEWPVKIADVDCTVSKSICEKANVKAFPTLALIADGVLKGKYNGDASVQSFQDWLSSQNVMQEGSSPAASSTAEQLIEEKPAGASTTATHSAALKAVVYNLVAVTLARFPTESAVINMYFYWAVGMALLVGLYLLLFSMVEEEEEHDKES